MCKHQSNLIHRSMYKIHLLVSQTRMQNGSIKHGVNVICSYFCGGFVGGTSLVQTLSDFAIARTNDRTHNLPTARRTFYTLHHCSGLFCAKLNK